MKVMTTLHAIILGIVEGITEFLPVSSTGHLILTAKLFGLSQDAFLKTFEIAIQAGAIFSVVALYWKTFITDWEADKKIIAAFIPTALLGLLFYKAVKDILGNDTIVVWSLLLGGIALIVFEYFHREPRDATPDIGSISYRDALFIGCFQAIAFIPGVSRSAATIVGGLLLGIHRRTIVEFSFLLAVPTMIAATGLDVIKNAASFSNQQAGILGIGFIVSFIVALVSIKLFLDFITRYTFTPFGIYRIAVALLFLLLI